MKKTKIVCTLGPASDQKQVLTEMINAGMNVARLNFSHGSHEEHREKIDVVKEVRGNLDKPVAIMLDTKGPEIRIKSFEEGRIDLQTGATFTLNCDETVVGNEFEVGVTYCELYKEVSKGNMILIDDGLVGLEVEEIQDKKIICKVKNGGELKNNKSVNVPDVNIQLPAITEKDKRDIIFGIQEGVDFIAASFVRKIDDVIAIRKVLEENDGPKIQIISKIENREGVNNIDGILEVSDGIMVARGDLGVEIPAEEVPLVQKEIIKKCNIVGKPVITATQMLDSMIRNPRPTRAEVTDVANAIFDGTDAIMLSGETAVGKFPVSAIETMARIAKQTEKSQEYKERRLQNYGELSITNAVSSATCEMVEHLDAAGIVVATVTGYTARMVSKNRPESVIVAIADTEEVVRKLNLCWGVYPLLINEFKNIDVLFEECVVMAVKEQLLSEGDLVVITAGIPLGVAGSTNMLKVETIGHFIFKGMGIGKGSVSATARVVLDGSYEGFSEGDILVAHSIDAELVPFVKNASAIITEEGGMTSQGAIAGLQYNIPVIVGVKNITDLIQDGTTLSLDPKQGVIYKGVVKLL
jgi:pyruvate kinase